MLIDHRTTTRTRQHTARAQTLTLEQNIAVMTGRVAVKFIHARILRIAVPTVYPKGETHYDRIEIPRGFQRERPTNAYFLTTNCLNPSLLLS